MAETDLSEWLPIADAAAAIGCSTRTVERLARARQLEQRLRPQAGSPAVAVYNPDDVARLATERRPAPPPFVVPAVQTPTNGNGHRGAANTTDLRRIDTDPNDPIRQLCAFVLHALQSPPSPPKDVTVSEMAERPAYVDRAEALTIAGVSYGALRAAVQAGEVKQRGRRYRRKDLEAL